VGSHTRNSIENPRCHHIENIDTFLVSKKILSWKSW